MSAEGGPPSGDEITARNWQDPPFNRWRPARRRIPCPRTGCRAAAGLRPAPARGRRGLLAIRLTRADGSAGTVADVLAGTFTDAYAVLQDGELAAEWYGPQGAPDRPHALMSVSKSVVGCVTAVLTDRGRSTRSGRSPTTSRNSPPAGTSARRCGTSWTCAAGSGSVRSTPTLDQTCAGWMSGSDGGPAGRAASRAGSTRS